MSRVVLERQRPLSGMGAADCRRVVRHYCAAIM